MSKAILVIDIPDVDGANVFLWKPKIEYKLYNEVYIDNEPLYVEMGIRGYELLKPLPARKEERVKLDGFSWELENIMNAERRGFNRCLDEILGEKE